MKRRIISILTITMLLLSLVPFAAFAADTITLETISAQTPNSQVTIKGTTTLGEVSIKVIKPDGTRLYIDVVSAETFTDGTTFTLPSTANGTYTVVVGKGSDVATGTFTVKADDDDDDDGGSGGTITTPDDPNEGVEESNTELENAAEDLSNADTPEEVEDAINKVIDTLKDVADDAGNATDAGEAADLADNISNSLKETTKKLDVLTDPDTAKDLAKDSIGVAADVINALKNNENVAGEKEVQKAIKKAAKDAVKMTQKALDKSGEQKVTAGTDGTAQVSSTDITEKVEKLLSSIKELKKELESTGISEETGKNIETKVTVTVETQGKDQVKTELPALDSVFEKVEKVAVKSDVAEFELNKDTFGEQAAGKAISLTAEKVDKTTFPEAVQQFLPKNSVVVNFTAEVDGNKVDSFNGTMDVAIPYDLPEGENPNEVTIFLLQDDRSTKAVGGVYNEATGMVEFTTNHFSFYFAKASVKKFSDLFNFKWAEDQVKTLGGKGIISGRDDQNFDPEASITRAEFAALLTRMLKFKGDASTLAFNDISGDAWYANEVAAAYKNGIVNGKSDTSFDPNGKITRQEMATMIARVLKKQGYTLASDQNLGTFKDNDAIAAWAKEGVATAAREEIVNGMTSDTFAPQADANRAQAAVMLYRLLFLD